MTDIESDLIKTFISFFVITQQSTVRSSNEKLIYSEYAGRVKSNSLNLKESEGKLLMAIYKLF